MREVLEPVVKDSNKLKAKKCLNAGKNHPGFLDHRSCFFFKARRSRVGVLVFQFHSESLFYSILIPLKNAAAHLIASAIEFAPRRTESAASDIDGGGSIGTAESIDYFQSLRLKTNPKPKAIKTALVGF